MKKLILLTLSALACSFGAYSQISYGGTPPSFKYSNKLRSADHLYTVDTKDINVERLIWEDSISSRNGSPLRLATIIPVDVDMYKTGEWTTLPDDSRIWQQTISVPGARGIIPGYKDLYIPEGGRLFIYNKDRSQLLGAYTHETNPGGGKFSNEIVSGDEITFEYVDSNSSTEQPRLVIEDVGYVYRMVTYSTEESAPNPANRIGKAAKCIININCEEGDSWRNQQRGVVRIAMKFPNNWSYCSGTLVNNTNNDGTPYILTANHCFFVELPTSPNTIKYQADFHTAHFYFNFEHPSCSNTNTVPSTMRSLVGSDFMTQTMLHGGSDGLLLKLKETVPLDWRPYYNGWDVNANQAASGVAIQHPQGDVKKIATYTMKPLSITCTIDNNYGSLLTGAKNAHWEIINAPSINGHSVTDGGSSGCPLFNSQGLIIGTLSGGASFCSTPNNPDNYGKMWYHWDRDSDPARRMKPFLDPTNSGALSLQGYDPNGGHSIDNPREIIKIVMFPNPAQEEFNINTRYIINFIKVTDMSGRIVFETKDLKSSTAVVPVSALPNGIYNVLVETEEGVFSDKIIKN